MIQAPTVLILGARRQHAVRVPIRSRAANRRFSRAECLAGAKRILFLLVNPHLNTPRAKAAAAGLS